MSQTQPTTHQPTVDPFAPAVRAAMKAAVMVTGLAGAGKTYTSLLAMRELVGPDGRIAFIDTERRSSTLYADELPFHVSHLGPFTQRWNPVDYINDMLARAEAAAEHGYDGLVVDSFSHAWDAVLRVVDNNNKGGLSGWLVGTPLQQRIVNTLLGLDVHLILTARAKPDWAMNEVTRTGRDGRERTIIEPTKVGMGSHQRPGLDYEFQYIGAIDLTTHTMHTEKTRVRAFADAIVPMDGTRRFWREYGEWLATGQDISSPAQLETIAELIEETREHSWGRQVRDEIRALRDLAGAETIDQLTKAQARDLIDHVRDLIDNGVAGADPPPAADAPAPAPEAATGSESGQSGDVEPTPAVAAPVAPRAGRVVVDGPDREVGDRHLWLPAQAVPRFVRLLARAWGTTPEEVTDDMLVFAAQEAYDPAWPTDGCFEHELAAAVDAIMAAPIDAERPLYPDQPNARELVSLAREQWADPTPPDPEPVFDPLGEDDEPGSTVVVGSRRASMRASRS